MSLEVGADMREPETSKPRNHGSRETIAWLAAVIAASVAPYLSSLRGGFVLDDQWLIVEDRFVHSLRHAWEVFGTYFLHGYIHTESLYYRPLVTLSYQLNYALSGADPFAFRLTNLLLHALAASLVFVLVRRLTKSAIAAGVAGVVFGVLPSHVQVAAWIAGRTDSVSTVFALGAFMAFLSAHPAGSQWRWRPTVLCFVLTLCALFSKESAIALPLLMAAYVWVYMPVPRGRELVRLLCLLVLPAVAYLLLRHHALGSIVHNLGPYLLKERLLRLGDVYATYLRLMLVPQETRIYYGILMPGMRFSVVDVALLSAPAGLIAVSVWARKRLPILSFASAWIFLSLLPASDLVPTYAILPAERYVYLASVGSSLLIGWLAWRAWDYRPRNLRTLPAAVVLLVLGYVFSCGTMAFYNSRCYASNLTWARLTAKENPPTQELRLLAAQYFVEAECVTEAAGEYEAAIRLGWNDLTKAKQAKLAYGLGRVYAQSGNMEKAAEAFSLAVGARPDLGLAWRDLARADVRLGKFAAAVDEFGRASSLVAPSTRDRFELGLAYAGLGKGEQAARQMRFVISESPDSEVAKRAQHVLASLSDRTRR